MTFSGTLFVVLIRLLKPKDIPAAAAIIRQNYSERYARLAATELQEMFGKAAIKPFYFVAVDDGKIVGLVGCMQSWMDYDVFTIFWVNVAPRRQQQGIGRMLVRKALAALRKNQALVVLLTTSSPAYYRRHFGFRTVTRFKQNTHHLMAHSFE